MRIAAEGGSQVEHALLAAVAGGDGDTLLDAADWRAVLEEWEGTERQYERTYVAIRAAEAGLPAGRREDAAVLLAGAVDSARELGPARC